MPKRAVAALITTALALALLLSFKTPADSGAASGAPALVSIGPGSSIGPAPSSGPLAGGPGASDSPAPAGSRRPASTPAPTKAAGKGSGTFTGDAVEEPFGVIQVQVTMTAGKLTAVTVVQMPTRGRSGFISADAAPILESEALAAQSASIDTVSGATYTSQAYAQSLQSALDQAKG
ncbi:MAG TPA: FMN-binding protein [Candidatus Limnocylindrales bacterium]